ncbi:MAG: ribonuclease E/G [Bauldia sp.]|nr:ribonuclease E/G [Bauldia sp.]
MANKMLIDASHPEETRVVVVRGNRVEDFDFESANRKQLRGNIYLAKVTRVEPSLQAAFVDYGGNRHGFLAFSEIHPDYYQIPVADRQALMEAEEKAEHEERRAEAKAAKVAEERAAESEAEPSAEAAPGEGSEDSGKAEHAESGEGGSGTVEEVHEEEQTVESVGAEDALEELPERRKIRTRQYKIQEVIKRRQVLLVQVVKEERGTKGAALTTYLSLAGRYSVLMPNTARGGGISRKITNVTDRKRLKTIATDLEVPEGMGVILRTAGASRTKAEVKRDFEYLLRLWENVRELTLKSIAPTLVYEEGSLIKRAIRDLYNRDIDEILVAGEEGYREAKDFMRMLMPSHAKNVQPYREVQPLFTRNSVESQLDAMFSPQVTLRSGGYIVINQTEALVSIDVNSGRSTREHNIEDTAHATNLEAADEVARQLRLRDLAGLIVIDFIDMEEKRNNRSVERRLKEALKNDRARIQVGRISPFGLLEMSRQRTRTSVIESTTELCPHCHGTGHVRSPSSVALHVLRSLEDNLLKGVTHDLIVRTRTAVALYILNQKRPHLSELESRFGLSISVLADESVTTGAHYVLERGNPVAERAPVPVAAEAASLVRPDTVVPEEEAEPAEDRFEAEHEDEETVSASGRGNGHDGEQGDRKRRRRRRRRRGGEGQPGESRNDQPGAFRAESGETIAAEADDEESGGDGETDGEREPREQRAEEGGERKRRRRGRRGGRRNGGEGRGEGRSPEGGRPVTEAAMPLDAEWPSEARGEEPPAPVSALADEPARASRAESDEARDEGRIASGHRDHVEAEAASSESEAETVAETPKKPERAPEPPEDDNRPKRGGWWQRRSFFG